MPLMAVGVSASRYLSIFHQSSFDSARSFHWKSYLDRFLTPPGRDLKSRCYRAAACPYGAAYLRYTLPNPRHSRTKGGRPPPFSFLVLPFGRRPADRWRLYGLARRLISFTVTATALQTRALTRLICLRPYAGQLKRCEFALGGKAAYSELFRRGPFPSRKGAPLRDKRCRRCLDRCSRFVLLQIARFVAHCAPPEDAVGTVALSLPHLRRAHDFHLSAHLEKLGQSFA